MMLMAVDGCLGCPDDDGGGWWIVEDDEDDDDAERPFAACYQTRVGGDHGQRV